jgi:hypothetical protein
MKQTKPTRKSLDQFRMAKKQAVCNICALPAAVKRQLKNRDPHLVQLPIVIEWLKAEWGIVISRAEYLTHATAGHEWRKPRRR